MVSYGPSRTGTPCDGFTSSNLTLSKYSTAHAVHWHLSAVPQVHVYIQNYMSELRDRMREVFIRGKPL